MKSHMIDFEPIGRRGDCREGDSLLDCARSLGISLVNVCGGSGRCGACQVQVLQGSVSDITSSEAERIPADRLKQGYRLACQAYPLTDCKIRLPVESLTTQQRIQLEGLEVDFEIDPSVKSYLLEVPPATVDDLRSDEVRIIDTLQQTHGVKARSIDYAALCRLPDILREQQWYIEVVVQDESIIALLPPGQPALGVALDLGTTKVAAYLLDLKSGRTLASTGFLNPQIAYGEDLMSRISIAQDDKKMAEKLQRLLVEALNQAIDEMCRSSGMQPQHIVSLALAGNTAMHHLFLQLPVKQLGHAPYVAAASSALHIRAQQLGIQAAPAAQVHLFPNVAGFVGGDHVAMLLACGIEKLSGVVLAVDIGTNTEICLSNRGVLSSLSTASGPAFEGAHIQAGMRAAAGAIERFHINNGEVQYQTIDNAAPSGLCGSGILDVLAQLFRAGIIDRRGRMQEHPRVRGRGREREFVISTTQDGGNEVCFSQKDVEQLLLAKGAIQTGIDVLLAGQGLSAADIDEVVVAGAFGTYLDVESAISIGMLPQVPAQRVSQIGNAAGAGAKMALLSQKKWQDAIRLAQNIRYVELAGDANFADAFARSMRMR